MAGRGSSASSFFVLCLLFLFLFGKQFFGAGRQYALSQARGQGRTVCSFSAGQPPRCETEGSNGRLAERVLCARERVCVRAGPKDVLLLIQKPSIALSPHWFLIFLLATVVYFSSAI